MSDSTDGVAARELAIRALLRIETDGAYANLVLPPMLDRSKLADRDRRLVTELVYGTTRMRRACDFLVDRFVLDDVEPEVRAGLRLGAYQLHFMRTPPHAAVAATVGAVRGRGRSVVNAVLRRVASAEVEWPNEATRLSYPDWIVKTLGHDLDLAQATDALESMNDAATVHTRDDGYIQDPASQLVTDALDVKAGERLVDVCAAPGGKATSLNAAGAIVIAADLRPNRAKLIARNAARLEQRLPVIIADGAAPPLRPGAFDKVLIDAPCSGLGSLRRRPDARWRIDAEAPARLAELQVRLVVAGLELLRPGGELTYSVCTLTNAETTGVLGTVRQLRPAVEMLPVPEGPWLSRGAVGHVLPAETDGMSLFRLRVPG
ncbi:MAG: 16S rRNA (cytosine967-C5)-methyltransferase [Acidimicrobiales bacterium]|jgi:16S rRNA (cytosine967-C5)-methyltransferase